MSAQPFENHLINEKSPYLLQHAHNLVDWHPWGEAAFSLSKSHDKPIFLSIGYTTCYWCRVMSHESFDNPEIASIMNDVFVSIKVDREELPEIDSLYMDFAQTLMDSDADDRWPLNILLTTDLKPFYATTYIPPNMEEQGMGLVQLISHIKQLWQGEERELLFDQAETLVNLFKRSALVQGDEPPTEVMVSEALERLFEGVNPAYGGISVAPTLPLGYQAHFFLDYAKVYDDPRPLFFVELSLNMMDSGGINDHVGGGIFRCSVDEQWVIPHFEKRLCDNAFIGGAYLDAWRLTKKERYRRCVERILDYVLRDMMQDGGGFYSVESADVDGVEEAFYLWSLGEVQAILSEEECALFCEFFDITLRGNFKGKNVLHCSLSLEEFAEYKNVSYIDLEEKFGRCLNLLLNKRIERPTPFKDDKVLVSWNAFMIDTCVRAGISFQNETYLNAGLSAARFIRGHLWRRGKLLRRFRAGHSGFDGNLDDYSSLIRSLITLYEAGQGVEWLNWAIEMTAIVEREFKAEAGAFYLTDSKRCVPLRRCELYDSLQPSGNSLHMENLLRLYQITHCHNYLTQAEDVLKAARECIEFYPTESLYHLISLMRYVNVDAPTFIIALDEDRSLSKELSRLIHAQFIPHSAIIWADDGDCEHLPIEGKTTLYIYKRGRCLFSLYTWSEMEQAFLDEKWKT